jgi:hypothetical protein
MVRTCEAKDRSQGVIVQNFFEVLREHVRTPVFPMGQFLGQFGYRNFRYESRNHTGISGTNPRTMRGNPVIRVPPRTTLNQ